MISVAAADAANENKHALPSDPSSRSGLDFRGTGACLFPALCSAIDSLLPFAAVYCALKALRLECMGKPERLNVLPGVPRSGLMLALAVVAFDRLFHSLPAVFAAIEPGCRRHAGTCHITARAFFFHSAQHV